MKANKISAGAKAAIEKAGGQAEVTRADSTPSSQVQAEKAKAGRPMAAAGWKQRRLTGPNRRGASGCSTTALINIFRIAELRKRLLFTLALLAVYRLGIFVTTPGRGPRRR